MFSGFLRIFGDSLDCLKDFLGYLQDFSEFVRIFEGFFEYSLGSLRFRILQHIIWIFPDFSGFFRILWNVLEYF